MTKFLKEMLIIYIAENNLKDDDFLFYKNKPISETTLKRKLDYYIEVAKIKHITVHGFRKSFATLLYSQFKDFNHCKLISLMLGHTKENITVDYYVYNSDDKVIDISNYLNQIKVIDENKN